MREVVILSAVRTPIGSFNGTLSSQSAVDLGTVVAKEAIQRSGIDPSIIDEVIIGNVLSAGLGQSVARQITLKAGIPENVPAMNIDKVCGSGLRAISLAASIIKAGDADVILAGGTESMSNAPYILEKARTGYRMGDGKLIDSMIKDGLVDGTEGYHMGITAENVAEKWGISREEQDTFALNSQLKAEKAQKANRFAEEIVPVTIPVRKGDPIIFEHDEYPRHGSTIEKLGKLRPAFKKEGTVTAGNASGINDGAAMMIIMLKDRAEELGLKPLVTVKAYGSIGLNPEIMGYGPAPATNKVLEKANITIDDIDLAEINEAFASQSIAVVRDLKIDPNKVNINGGAIALGHPIGASGTRIAVTLLHEMLKQPEAKTGLAALCIGGGMGSAIVFEKV